VTKVFIFLTSGSDFKGFMDRNKSFICRKKENLRHEKESE
jgi:hypothetical protein